MNEQPPGEPDFAPLIDFFKALSNTERLRVAGAIAETPRTAAEVAAATGLPARSVVGHLGLLAELGFARREGEGGAARYAWDEMRVRALAAAQLDTPRARELAGARDERSKVLAAFIRDGRLISFPTGEARKIVILDYIVERFEAGRVYTEREINEVLKPFAEDYTTIRRALVDRAYLNRKDGVYWVGEGRRA